MPKRKIVAASALLAPFALAAISPRKQIDDQFSRLVKMSSVYSGCG